MIVENTGGLRCGNTITSNPDELFKKNPELKKRLSNARPDPRLPVRASSLGDQYGERMAALKAAGKIPEFNPPLHHEYDGDHRYSRIKVVWVSKPSSIANAARRNASLSLPEPVRT